MTLIFAVDSLYPVETWYSSEVCIAFFVESLIWQGSIDIGFGRGENRFECQWGMLRDSRKLEMGHGGQWAVGSGEPQCQLRR